MTDNVSTYRSKLFRETVGKAGRRRLRAKPYCPRTNGKAERFIQTSLRDWAYATTFSSSNERTKTVQLWLDAYNRKRPYSAIGHITPWRRVNNLLGNNT